MVNIDTAVFLAAGLGSRLEGIGKDKPKGFLEIDGISLIERSVKKLVDAGIKKFYFGTGHLAEFYEEFAKPYDATCILNPIFATTGSMYTLYNMREQINRDFLLLEADLLYDRSGISLLLDNKHKDVILASDKTFSGDEVFIETTAESMLVNMSKDPANLAKIDAELVGISKVSLVTYRKMCEFAGSQFESKPKLDYEYVFVEMSKAQDIFVKKAKGYVWCEIDDPSHYKRALELIYPKIQ